MNHLQVIQALIELDYNERALEHIKKLANEGKITKSKCDIGVPEIESALLSHLTPAREAGCHIEVDCMSLKHDFPYDPFDVVKILSNLIRNAVQALETYDSEYKELSVQIHRDENSFFLKVKNNGPLIPEDLRDAIFEKGFSTKRESGRGLGLFIVKRIVEKNQGSIHLDVDATGNLFTVVLPVLKELG